MKHAAKQHEALASITHVFGELPVLDGFLGRSAPSAAIAGEAEELKDEIRLKRESALYVDLAGGEVSSPVSAISQDEAAKYVRMAQVASWSRQWLLGTPDETVADFLQHYRSVWLAIGGPELGDDLEKAVVAYVQLQRGVFEVFEFVTDESGAFIALAKKQA